MSTGLTNDHQSKKYHTTGKDIISELPRNVIDRILELMPIQDAVRTSALARNWRYNWTTISKLKFNFYFIEYLSQRSLNGADTLFRIITNVLLLHQSDILRFVLYIPEIDNARVGDIDNWILFLSRKGVKKLTLNNLSCPKNIRYRLPSHLYSCLNLTHLDVSGCVFNPPASFGGFPNLISFDCDQVTLETESFRYFISSCPLLKWMMLESCFGSDQLIIQAPSLDYLLVDCYRTRYVCIDVENLKTLHLFGNFLIVTNHGSEGSNMTNLFQGLLKIEELQFRIGTFKGLAAGGALQKITTPLIYLSTVFIYDFDFQDPAQVSGALCLIKSSPNLQFLKIQANTAAGNVIASSLGEDCVLSRLQYVSLCLRGCSRTELELIKSLLSSSPSLDVMSISLSAPGDSKLASQTMKELLRFHRASPKAEIDFS